MVTAITELLASPSLVAPTILVIVIIIVVVIVAAAIRQILSLLYGNDIWTRFVDSLNIMEYFAQVHNFLAVLHTSLHDYMYVSMYNRVPMCMYVSLRLVRCYLQLQRTEIGKSCTVAIELVSGGS